MEDFKDFSLLRTNELQVIKDGLFKPSYEVTDGQFCYGKIDHPWKFKKNSLLKLASGTWVLQRRGLFSRTRDVYSPDNENIGAFTSSIWPRKASLVMNNGFEASLSKKSTFSFTYNWTNMQQGDIMRIETNLWRINKPLKIVLTAGVSHTLPELPLLTLLGVHFVLLQKGGKH